MRLRRENNRMRFGVLVCLVGFAILALQSSALAYVYKWNAEPPMLTNDPEWDKVKSLWRNHAGGKNMDEIITILTSLKNKYPDKIEVYLCLAKAHNLHAWYFGKDKRAYFEKGEMYAAQACKMQPTNPYAIRTLIEALALNRDRNYIFSHYGQYLKSIAPLKDAYGELLPEMAQYPEWNAFLPLWQARLDMEKAKAAAVLAEKMAQAHPRDVMAQVWAARVYYYIGEVYTSLKEHDQKAIPHYEKGIAYAGKALKLDPQSVPANHWYVLNRARSIQFTSLMNKAKYLMDLLRPALFCAREDVGYFYFNMLDIVGTMITYGGWVTEKGMNMVGISVDTIRNGLELAEMLHPDYYYLPYCRADVLAYKGKKKEALAILENVLARNPDINNLIPENHSYQREARMLYEAIQQGKR